MQCCELLSRRQSCVAGRQRKQRLQLRRDEPASEQGEMIPVLIEQTFSALCVAERSITEDRSGIKHFERRYPGCQCAYQPSISAAAVVDGGP